MKPAECGLRLSHEKSTDNRADARSELCNEQPKLTVPGQGTIQNRSPSPAQTLLVTNSSAFDVCRCRIYIPVNIQRSTNYARVGHRTTCKPQHHSSR